MAHDKALSAGHVAILMACLQAARMLRRKQPRMMAGSLRMCLQPLGPSQQALKVLVKLCHLSGGRLEPGAAAAMHLCLRGYCSRFLLEQ